MSHLWTGNWVCCLNELFEREKTPCSKSDSKLQYKKQVLQKLQMATEITDGCQKT